MPYSGSQIQLLLKIEKYLSDGGDVNRGIGSRSGGQDLPWRTPMRLAIDNGFDDLFYPLLKNPNLDIYALRPFTALQYAMKRENDKYVRAILSYISPDVHQSLYNINAKDEWGETALTTAIFLPWRLRNKYVNLLLDHGASPNMVSNNGKTPFYHAIKTQEDIEDSIIIKQMIDKGANIYDKLYVHNGDTVDDVPWGAVLPAQAQTYLDVLESIESWDDHGIYRKIRDMLSPPAKKFMVVDKGGTRRRRKTRRHHRQRKRKTTKNRRKKGHRTRRNKR